MLLLTATVTPRPDLDTEQYRTLGRILSDWITRAKLLGLVIDAEAEGLDNLLAGEPPLPLVLRYLAGMDQWN
jgi:hypothetical protein